MPISYLVRSAHPLPIDWVGSKSAWGMMCLLLLRNYVIFFKHG